MRIGLALPAGFVVLFLSLGGCSRSIPDKVTQVENDLKAGDFASAQKIVDEIVKVDSLAAEAVYTLGLLDEFRGYDWEAIPRYIEAARMQDGYLPAMHAFTRLAIKTDYRESARKMARLILKRQPDDPQAYLYLAECDMLDYSLDSARVYLSSASQAGADDNDITLYQAEIDCRTYDENATVAALKKLSGSSFDESEQVQRLAAIYQYLNMGDSAVHYCRRAVEMNDDDLSARLQLAQYLYENGFPKDAYAIVDRIMTESDAFGPAIMLAAYIKWSMGQPNDAELLFAKYMTLLTQSPIAGEKHGDLLNYFGKANLAAGEWQGAYILAINLKYPDDYLRRLYLKMENGFLDDKDVAMGRDYYEEGKQLLPGKDEMTFIEAELKSYFEDVADSAKLLVDDQVSKYWNNRNWLALAGRYFYRKGQYDQALSVYSRLIQLPASDVEYYLRLLRIYKDKKDAAGIAAVTANTPFRFRQSRALREALVDAYLATGDIARATEQAEALYRGSTGDLPNLLTLADLYLRQQRADEARRLLVKYRETYPDAPESYYQLAKFDYAAGRRDSIITNLDRALTLDTVYAQAIELKGIYYDDAGKPDSALAYYREARRLQGPTPTAYHNLALYYFQQGDSLNVAANIAMWAVRHFDRDRRGYLLLGKIYYAQGKFNLARQQFLTGLKFHPDDAEYNFLLGKTLLQMKKDSDARDALKKAMELGLPPAEREEAQKLLSRT